MRVLVVTTVHHPLDARIYQRQVRSLLEAGHTVTYVAPWLATASRSELPGDALTALDVPRAVGRRRLRALCVARQLVRKHGPKHDLVLLHDPELVLAATGSRLPPVVLDVHEDLAASLADRRWLPAWSRSIAVRLVAALERWAERRFHLLLAERSYQKRFQRPHPVVLNLPWLPRVEVPAAVQSRVVYVGRISAGRGARELLSVGTQLAQRSGPMLHMVGAVDADVADELDQAVAGGSVVWHGFLPNEEALELVDGSVAGLSLLHDLANYRHSMPTKVVEYMARGVPVIATPLPEVSELVLASGAGHLVGFGDAAQVVDLVLQLDGDRAQAKLMGERGRAAVVGGLSWDREAEAFIQHLRSVAACR